MERFWKASLGVGGLAAVAYLVFYRLYDRWLGVVGGHAPMLSPEDSASLLRLFAILAFAGLVVGVASWLLSKVIDRRSHAAIEDLANAWKDVNHIACKHLVGPDVNRAANALQSTASYWRHRLVSSDQIFGRFGPDFVVLFEELDRCGKVVPGYESLGKTCRDFITPEVRLVYEQMKARS